MTFRVDDWLELHVHADSPQDARAKARPIQEALPGEWEQGACEKEFQGEYVVFLVPAWRGFDGS
jgi:hypothetical protein